MYPFGTGAHSAMWTSGPSSVQARCTPSDRALSSMQLAYGARAKTSGSARAVDVPSATASTSTSASTSASASPAAGVAEGARLAKHRILLSN